MKITLLKTDYIDVTLDNNFIDYKVKPNEEMSQEDFMEVMKTFTESLINLYQQGKIKKESLRILIDTYEGSLIVMPETQEYIDKHYFSQVIHLCKKLAIIPSKDFTSQVATQLLMEEENAQNFQTQYFTSREEAMNWLNA